MKIEFNKVTWYSKLGAILLFLLVVPILTFYIGRQYEALREAYAAPAAVSVAKHAPAKDDYVAALPSDKDAPEGCSNPETQELMDMCAGYRASQAESAMQDSYQKALTNIESMSTPGSGYLGMPPPAYLKDDFAASQAAWMKYRDTDCKVASDTVEGGSMQPMVASTCETQLTIERTKELDSFSTDIYG